MNTRPARENCDGEIQEYARSMGRTLMVLTGVLDFWVFVISRPFLVKSERRASDLDRKTLVEGSNLLYRLFLGDGPCADGYSCCVLGAYAEGR